MAEIDDRVAQQMFTSIIAGLSFEDAGLPDDTDEMREAWDEIEESINSVPPGVAIEVPKEWPGDEYTEMASALYDDEFWATMDDDMAKAAAADEATLVSKSIDERRFTLGPMYIPNRLDAHAEWTDPDELQKSVWDYVRKGDRRIRLQHNRDVVAGEALEVMAWPYEVDVPMVQKSGESLPMTFPANTVFLGVQWEPWAWELVKAGKIRGYSIGGKAERLLVDLPEA